MGYRRHLDGTFDDLVKCGKGVVGAAADPYLPEIMCRLEQLRALSVDRTPIQAIFGKRPTVHVPSCKPTGATKKSKTGLDRVSIAMSKLVYLNQHPTAIWLGLSAALAVPFILGFAVGRKSHRR